MMHRSNSLKRFNPSLKLARHVKFGEFVQGKPILPINVEISPTGKCQAKCEWCFYDGLGEKNKNFLVEFEKEKLRELLFELSGLGVKAVTWTGGGDPTLYPHFCEMVDLAHHLGLDQGLFTNAIKEVQYDPSKLNWIRVSNTDKNWKVENILNLRKCKTVGMCVNYSGDDSVVYAAIEAGQAANVDYVQIRPALALNGLLTKVEPPKIEHPLLVYTGYKFSEAGKPRGYTRCEGYHFIPFIWQDGSVDVCAYHWNEKEYNLGNIYKNSFKQIMSEAPQSVAVAPNCQTCCKLHEINLLIDGQKGLEDVNFP